MKLNNNKIADKDNIIHILKNRFNNNIHRHKNLNWSEVENRLATNFNHIKSLIEMENTGGEPDVIVFENQVNSFIFVDCSKESPIGRRSLCYDSQGLDSRKEFKPLNSAIEIAKEMGIDLLDEKLYLELQKIENFDTKTSSWLKTPSSIRELGGAIYGDFRFGRAFIYHNGAQSYYSSRGFRGYIIV